MSSRTSTRLAAKAASNKTIKEEKKDEGLSSSPAQRIRGKVTAAKGISKRAKENVSLKNGEHQPQKIPVTSEPINSSTPAAEVASKAENGDIKSNTNGAKGSAKKGTKRKRASPAPKVEEDEDELPHNMGKRVATGAKVKQEDVTGAKTTPKNKGMPKSAEEEERAQDADEILNGTENPPKKKAKKSNGYGLTPGETPFPDWPHPTPEECQTVHDLLLQTIEPSRRSRMVPPDDIPPPSEIVAGCGEVPSILDALIRTLLSAATNGRNSSNSFQGLVKRFGLATEGRGKGSVNWTAVHEASLQDVFEAIKSGGLAKNKSQQIKNILAMVHEENKQRLTALLEEEKAGVSSDIDEEEKAERALELRTLNQGILTLDYYHRLEKDDALSTFTNYPGIGVKTAACVNLFCMQRPCFAVDTHVFRLCQYLGWVPPEDSREPKQKKVDRNTTFSHCEVRVPDHLKYGLHQLFLEHGKKCPRCRAVTGEKSEGWADANCPIEHLVKRLGAKKGGVDSPKKLAAKAKKAKKAESSEDELSDVELSETESTEETPAKMKKTPAQNRKSKPSPKKTTNKKSSPAKEVPSPVSTHEDTEDTQATGSKAATRKAAKPSKAKAASGTKKKAK